MTRSRAGAAVVIAIAAVAAGTVGRRVWQADRADQLRQIRASILEAIRPVALSNCMLTRFGSPNDGGYLMCENLLDDIHSAYSYGIASEDNWGCEVSRRLRVPIHQYDCFTSDRPSCDGGTFVFHAECVGDAPEQKERRAFDTVVNQLAKNGDTGRRVLIKMDVEGSEIEALMSTPDEVLANIAQLPMELHGVDQRFLDLILKLKRTFHVVGVHFNNWGCEPNAAPMPGVAYQVLFVNRDLGILDPGGTPHQPGAPPDAPDNPDGPDCQPRF
jgi:hypothetical protein